MNLPEYHISHKDGYRDSSFTRLITSLVTCMAAACRLLTFSRVFNIFLHFRDFSQLLKIDHLVIQRSTLYPSESDPLTRSLKIGFLHHLFRGEILILEARRRCKMTAWFHIFKRIYSNCLNLVRKNAGSKNDRWGDVND